MKSKMIYCALVAMIPLLHCGLFGRTIQVTSNPPADVSYVRLDEKWEVRSSEVAGKAPQTMRFWPFSRKKIMLETPGFARAIIDPAAHRGQKSIHHEMKTNVVVMADTSLVPGSIEDGVGGYFVKRRYRTQKVDRSRVATVLLGREHPFFAVNEKRIEELRRAISALEEQIKKQNEMIIQIEAEAKRLEQAIGTHKNEIAQALHAMKAQAEREKTLYPEQAELRAEIKRQDEIIRLANEKKRFAEELLSASLREQKERGDRERAAIEAKRQKALGDLARAQMQLRIELMRTAGPLQRLRQDVQSRTQEKKRSEKEMQQVMDNT